MVLFCGECALAFPQDEKRTIHRYETHKEMFPEGDGGCCHFCGLSVNSYFHLHDHIEKDHKLEFSFLVEMGARMNTTPNTIPKSTVFWMQVAYVPALEMPGPFFDPNVMTVMWDKMVALSKEVGEKPNTIQEDDRDDTTPPALLHLTNPQGENGHEDPSVDETLADSETSSSGSSSSEKASANQSQSLETRTDNRAIASSRQTSLSSSSAAPVQFVFPVDLGNGRTAFMPATQSPSRIATTSASRSTSNEERRDPRRQKTSTTSSSNGATTSADAQDSTEGDDNELVVIRHIKPKLKDPHELLSPTLTNGPLTPCQMAALMGRPIVAAGTSQESIQAVLEQQMDVVPSTDDVLSPSKTGGSGTSNILELACASIGIDDPGMGEEAGPSGALNGDGDHRLSVIQSPSDACISNVIDSVVLNNSTSPLVSLTIASVIDSVELENTTSPVIPVLPPTVANDSIKSPSITVSTDVIASILRSVASGQSISDSINDVLGGPSSVNAAILAGSSLLGGGGVVLRSPIGGSTVVSNSMSSIIGGCSSKADEAVFKVPQLPNEKSSASNRKRTLADEARKYFPHKMARVGDVAKAMMHGQKGNFKQAKQQQHSHQRALRQSNNVRLSILITTLLAIDNRKDRDHCLLMEKEFAAHFDMLDFALPENDEDLRVQLILAFTVLRNVLEAPLKNTDPMFTAEEQNEARQIAAAFWIYLPPLSGQKLFGTLGRLQNNIAFVMAQCPRVRTSLRQLSQLIKVHTEPNRAIAIPNFLKRMDNDISIMKALATLLGPVLPQEDGKEMDPRDVLFKQVFEVATTRSSIASPTPAMPTSEMLNLLMSVLAGNIPKLPPTPPAPPNPEQDAARAFDLFKRTYGAVPNHTPVDSPPVSPVAKEEEPQETAHAVGSPASVSTASPSRLVIVGDEEEQEDVAGCSNGVSVPPLEPSSEPVLKKFVPYCEAKVIYAEDKRIWLNTDVPIPCRYHCDMMATTSGMVSHYRRYHYDVYFQAVHKVWEESSINRWLAVRFGNVKTGTKEKRACVACRHGRADYNDRLHLAEHFQLAHPKYFADIQADYINIFKGKLYDDPVVSFLFKRK